MLRNTRDGPSAAHGGEGRVMAGSGRRAYRSRKTGGNYETGNQGSSFKMGQKGKPRLLVGKSRKLPKSAIPKFCDARVIIPPPHHHYGKQIGVYDNARRKLPRAG